MSLTLGAITAGIGSAISNIGQGALTIIRIIAIVGFATIFAGAIMAFFGLLSNVIMTSVIGEFFAIVSLCLPFSPHIVFGSILLVIDGAITFFIASKTYTLVSDMIGKTS